MKYKSTKRMSEVLKLAYIFKELKDLLFTFPCKSVSPAEFITNRMYVVNAIVGAANENVIRCFRIFVRSTPSCIRNVTRPNAAGALCSMIARKTINSTST